MTAFFAGLDWASQSHAVCIIDDHGNVRERVDIAPSAAGLTQLQRSLVRDERPPIAIERPSGIVVDTLLDAGFTVIPIHPNAVKATRPRYRSLLASFWPGAAEVFADVDSPIALAFVERYPTPESAHRLGPKRMAAFCAQHAYSGRRSAQDLLARLQQAPAGVCAEMEMEAKGELARSLARALSQLVEQIRLLSSRIEHHVESLDDGRIVMSFPRAGRICAAQILAEFGSVRERFANEARLAAEAGIGPVTYPSGKSRTVTFRCACNHRLRAALTCLADNSRHASVWAAHVYNRARARGCDHPHAVRVLARAWVRVIWRAWTDRKPYDPTRHGAAQLLTKLAGG
jgi:hypothetical protein